MLGFYEITPTRRDLGFLEKYYQNTVSNASVLCLLEVFSSIQLGGYVLDVLDAYQRNIGSGLYHKQ